MHVFQKIWTLHRRSTLSVTDEKDLASCILGVWLFEKILWQWVTTEKLQESVLVQRTQRNQRAILRRNWEQGYIAKDQTFPFSPGPFAMWMGWDGWSPLIIICFGFSNIWGLFGSFFMFWDNQDIGLRLWVWLGRVHDHLLTALMAEHGNSNHPPYGSSGARKM